MLRGRSSSPVSTWRAVDRRAGDGDPAVPGRVAVRVRRAGRTGLGQPPGRPELGGDGRGEVGGERLGRAAHPGGLLDRAGDERLHRGAGVHDRAAEVVRRRAGHGEQAGRDQPTGRALGDAHRLATLAQQPAALDPQLLQSWRQHRHSMARLASADSPKRVVTVAGWTWGSKPCSPATAGRASPTDRSTTRRRASRCSPTSSASTSCGPSSTTSTTTRSARTTPSGWPTSPGARPTSTSARPR